MSLAPEDPRHGTVGGYTHHRCRCDLCRQAKSNYRKGFDYDLCACGERKARPSKSCRVCQLASRRYNSAAEREEARRATGRRNRRRQYALYLKLIDRFGLKHQSEQWVSHLAEIRHMDSMPPENLGLWKSLKRRPYHRWWLERFTMDQIHVMAAGLTLLEGEPEDYAEPDWAEEMAA